MNTKWNDITGAKLNSKKEYIFLYQIDDMVGAFVGIKRSKKFVCIESQMEQFGITHYQEIPKKL